MAPSRQPQEQVALDHTHILPKYFVMPQLPAGTPLLAMGLSPCITSHLLRLQCGILASFRIACC